MASSFAVTLAVKNLVVGSCSSFGAHLVGHENSCFKVFLLVKLLSFHYTNYPRH